MVLLIRGWPTIGLSQLRAVPPVLYIGGMLGAIYVTSVILLVPKIGVANTLIAVIVGQVLLSLVLDHLGFLNLPMQRISGLRMIGASLVVTDLILVSKF